MIKVRLADLKFSFNKQATLAEHEEIGRLLSDDNVKTWTDKGCTELIISENEFDGAQIFAFGLYHQLW